MRLHLVALPHTQVRPEFCGCAYTAKILKFCKMMGQDYEILLYAPEGPDVPGATLIPCLTDARRQEIFGKDDPNRLPAWPSDVQTKPFNDAVQLALAKNLESKDLLLLSSGRTQLQLAEAFPQQIIVEPGVGYEGILPKSFCAFESYAHMHTTYAKNQIHDVRWFDTVIPNYFDPDEFPLLNKGDGKYLAFLGRVISRKGPQIAAQIAEACGYPLYIAGAGAEQVGDGVLGLETIIPKAKYIGPVNVRQRAEFLANAKALIVPTTYIEPFGGVAVEAMMCGTPVIASDCGAFTETVSAGESGFRFRTLQEAVDAVKLSQSLKAKDIRRFAMRNFSLDAVRPMFDHWFNNLSTLWGKGWYELDHEENSATLNPPSCPSESPNSIQPDH